MYTSLPNDLQLLVMDFYGDASIWRHRRFRFVRAELGTVFLLRQDCTVGPRPSFVRRVAGINSLKKVLQLAYLNTQLEALRKHQGRIA